MAEVRTRDEALLAVDRALSQWLATAAGVLQQATASAAGARSVADTEARKWATRASALKAQLDAVRGGEDPRHLTQELNRTQEAQQRAQQAAAAIDGIVRRLDALQRSHVQQSTSLVNDARADLSRRIGDLRAYRATGGAATGSESASQSPISVDTYSPWAGTGVGSVDVNSANFSSNPILDGFGKGGTTRSDYRWAVQAWHEVVAPGISRGLTRQDFASRDAEHGALPLRRTAAVYDLFLGDADRIRVSRMADGTYDVTNGRHRLQIARELGIDQMPGEVT